MAKVLGARDDDKDPPTEKIYHYGADLVGTAIRTGSFFTDFESTNVDDISEVTGRDKSAFKYRYTVEVAVYAKDAYFRSVADKWTSKGYRGQEYKNLSPISKVFLEVRAL